MAFKDIGEQFKDIGEQFKALCNLGDDLRKIRKEGISTLIHQSDNIQKLIAQCTKEIKEDNHQTREAVVKSAMLVSASLIIVALIIVFL
jgi:hypothetical protein